jgi:hypothetical protein
MRNCAVSKLAHPRPVQDLAATTFKSIDTAAAGALAYDQLAAFFRKVSNVEFGMVKPRDNLHLPALHDL